MKGEKFRLPSETEFKPAAEIEKDIPERLRRLHEVEGRFLSRGVFFDVYDIDLPSEEGEPEEFVFKDFRSGDITMSPEKQVALFQHQYYEWVVLKQAVGEKFFPKSFWIRSSEFSEEEAHGFFAKPGITPTAHKEFMKLHVQVQLNRHLANRYSSDDVRVGAINKIMAELGKPLAEHAEKPFIGAIVQEKVNGVSLAEALKKIDKSSPAYESFRKNIQELIQGLRRFHDENPIGAFTWHRLGSENVLAEVDENGEPTGNVYIVDANFTERPTKLYKEKVIEKMNKEIFQKLEEALEL